MNLIKSPFSPFEVTNFIAIFASIFCLLSFKINLTNLAPQPWRFLIKVSAASFIELGFGCGRLSYN
jgi:hypothetical protein